MPDPVPELGDGGSLPGIHFVQATGGFFPPFL